MGLLYTTAGDDHHAFRIKIRIWGEGGNDIILEVYVEQTLLGISKRFLGNGYKLSRPKPQCLETYTFRNNSGTLAASLITGKTKGVRRECTGREICNLPLQLPFH
jgi:hypothetical protein